MKGIYHAPKGVMLDTDAGDRRARPRDLPAGRPQPRHAARQRHGDHAGKERALHGRLVRGRAEISMTNILLRGRTLSFLRWPESADDYAA